MDFVISKLKRSLRALESKNYRLFFAGQAISLIGTWMTQGAMIWLVYHFTNSALLLAVVGFSSQIPSFVIAPFGGIFVDRWNHRENFSHYSNSRDDSVFSASGFSADWHHSDLAYYPGEWSFPSLSVRK